jgi:peptide/nickel transport system permease protein
VKLRRGIKKFFSERPVARLLIVRSALGVVTLFAVSVIVFLATEVLPGNAAVAALGHSAPKSSIEALEHRLHLREPVLQQYWHWLTGVLHGDFGTSLVNGHSVTSSVGPMIANSAVLVAVTAVIAIFVGLFFGALAALRQDSVADHVMSVLALAASALPEFVVGIFVVLIFSISVFHWFPAVSLLQPGERIWEKPELLVLPTLTLVIVVVPYIFRMTRATTIEAFASEFSEVATLKGVPRRRVLLGHAMPNAAAPIVQVIGLNILYLAGGIVLVEEVFNFPGIGQGLVNAVSDRDIPMIQCIVLLLAVVYVVVNITTDLIVLLVSPRRRLASR